jgi:hypothetical protein
MVDKRIFVKDLKVSEKWSPDLKDFGKQDKKWVAEVEVDLININSDLIGDLCWFYICSTSMSIEEIKTIEEFNIQNKYISQNRLDLQAAAELIKEKLNLVNNDIHGAVTFLFFD